MAWLLLLFYPKDEKIECCTGTESLRGTLASRSHAKRIVYDCADSYRID